MKEAGPCKRMEFHPELSCENKGPAFCKLPQGSLLKSDVVQFIV